MKSYLLLFLGIFAFAQTKAQTGRSVQAPVVRQTTNDSIYTYQTLELAITAAKDTGDVIYLPGGMFRLPTTLSKKLTIYGTGYRSDTSSAMNPTQLIGNMTISSVTNYGIYIYDAQFVGNSVSIASNSNVSIFFERCQINAFNLYSANSTINFTDCVINHIYQNGSGSNSIFNINNCVIENDIYSQYSGSASSVIIKNSVLLGNVYNNSYHSIANFNLIQIDNSILFSPASNTFYSLLAGFTAANMNNCLVVSDTSRLTNIQFAGRGNIRKDQSFRSSIFENFPNYLVFTEPSNYKTKVGCTECANKGIYNGSQFRAYPPVHIWERVVTVGSDGNLNISFKVRTQ